MICEIIPHISLSLPDFLFPLISLGMTLLPILGPLSHWISSKKHFSLLGYKCTYRIVQTLSEDETQALMSLLGFSHGCHPYRTYTGQRTYSEHFTEQTRKGSSLQISQPDILCREEKCRCNLCNHVVCLFSGARTDPSCLLSLTHLSKKLCKDMNFLFFFFSYDTGFSLPNRC